MQRTDPTAETMSRPPGGPAQAGSAQAGSAQAGSAQAGSAQAGSVQAEPGRFAPVPASIAAARRYVRRLLSDWAADELLDDALLLVSELATNAVVHAGTAFEVRCVHLGDAIRLDVRDRYPARGLPGALPLPDARQSTGRGLLLCATLSAAWGVEYTPTAKTVWCRLDLPGGTGAGAAVPAGRPAGSAAAPVPSGVLVGVVGTGPDGLIRDWNADAEALLGWPAAEVRGRPLQALVADPGDTAAGTPDEPAAAAGGRWSGELSLSDRVGRPVPVYATRVPAADPATEPAGAAAAGAAWLLVRLEQRDLLAAAGQRPAAPADPDWATFGDADLLRLRLEDVLQRAVDRACDALDGDAAYLLLSAGDGAPARLVSTGLAGRPPDLPLPVEPTADQLAAGALPAVYDDLAATELLPVLSGTSMRSAVVAQLLTEGRSIGQVGVASARPARFGRDDAVQLQRGADRLALSIEARRLAESTRRQRDWLGFLAEASDLLAGTLDPQMTVAMFAQLLVPRLATWCAIRLFDERGAAGLDHAWHVDETRIADVRELLLTVPDPGAPARTPTPVGDRYGGLGPAAAPAVLRDHTLVTLPLRARGHGLGVALVGRPPEQPFDSDTLALTEEVVRRAALAVDNALLYRTHQATSRALQRSLLPAALPAVPGLDVGVAYQAAGEGLDVGGDFYDLFALGDGRWRCTVGDVAGNGPEAAGVTGLARHTLRLLGRQLCPPAEAVGQLNEAILDQPDGTRFLTVLHGEITRRPAGGLRVELVVAGHPLPYLLSPDGRATQVGTPQPLLGVLDQVRYRTDTILLAPGDTLLCPTDGVMERRGDGRVLGDDDLLALLGQCAGMSARAIATAVQRAVIEYSAEPPRDDMAVLVLRALP